MRLERPWSLQKLSATACAVAVAISFGGMHAANETDALAGIQRYCTVSWRNAGIDSQDWDDCTQDAVMLLLGRVPRQRLSTAIDDANSEERRALNRSVWCIAKRWQRSARHVSLNEFCSYDCASEGSDIAEQIEQVDQAGRVCLTSRQQRILSLSSQGWSVSEIADELGLANARISDEKYKAINKLRKHFSV